MTLSGIKDYFLQSGLGNMPALLSPAAVSEWGSCL